MIRYPNLPIATEADIEAGAGIEMEVTEGGAIRGRELYSSVVYDMELVHPLLRPEQVRRLEDFYARHRLEPSVILLEGCRYEVRFVKPPQVDKRGPVYRDVTVTLLGIRA